MGFRWLFLNQFHGSHLCNVALSTLLGSNALIAVRKFGMWEVNRAKCSEWTVCGTATGVMGHFSLRFLFTYMHFHVCFFVYAHCCGVYCLHVMYSQQPFMNRIWKLKFIGACYMCVCGLIALILWCSVVRLRMFCCQLVCGRYFCFARTWLMGLSQRRKGVLFAWRNTRLRNFCGSWLASESPPQSS